MFSLSFEIMALMAQPAGPDADAFVHQVNDMHVIRVSAKPLKSCLYLSSKLERHSSTLTLVFVTLLAKDAR